MDNSTRSDQTRRKAIDAALTILSRVGIGGLTFEAISRESGVSRGGLIHQFHNKEGMIAALLAHQVSFFEQIGKEHLANSDPDQPERTLSAQLAIHRESAKQPNSVGRAVLAAMVESPELTKKWGVSQQSLATTLESEAEDPELSLLRYFAATGLAFNMLVGITPISAEKCDALFARLMDDSRWKSGKADD